MFGETTADTLSVYEYSGGFVWQLRTTQVFRDPSAWFHLCIAVDTTQATASNRVKIYVNGSQVTAFAVSTYPSQNHDTFWSTTNVHTIGAKALINTYFSGYLADIYFIDGQALTPSSFTETDATTGQLVEKAYTGSYGTNGFHLEFADNSSNTATTLGKDTSGNGNNWTPNNLSVITGGPTSVASASGALPIYNTTDTYGAVKGTGTRTDSNSSSIVLAIPMDGANNGTTFTDESATIKGSGSAKTISRFGDTKTSTAQSKFYGSSGFFDGTGDYLQAPAGTDFSYGTGDFTFEAWIYPTTSGTDRIIYAQTTSGNNYVNLALTTSNTFSVQINASGAGNNVTSTGTVTANVWTHIAVTRQSTVVKLFINGVQDGSGTRNVDLQISSTVPTIGTFSHASTLNFTGYIQDFRIYKGVAKYTANFNPPSSTQNPSIAAGNDSLVDVPTNGAQTDTGVGGEVRGNYATLNPLVTNSTTTLANGNLDATGSEQVSGFSSIVPSSGKWYLEITLGTVGANSFIGLAGTTPIFGSYCVYGINGFGFANTGWGSPSSTVSGTGAAGDVIGLAFDVDAKTLQFYKNGSSIGTISAFTFPQNWSIGFRCNAAVSTPWVFNFGQRPFAYTAPSGFKALNTANLPAPLVTKPNTVMDVALYTGNGSARSITGLGFNPDLVWIKSRSAATDHELTDSVRGTTKSLSSNLTAAEATDTGGLTAFNSDGFSLGTDTKYNNNAATYVAWAWDAGTTTTTNTQGSITSSVRANATAGFSIVSYTGTGTSPVSVGHGLGVAPTFLIFKDRDSAVNWQVWTTAISSSGTIFEGLNTTAAGSTPWTYISTTSSLIQFNSGNSAQTTNGKKFICYAFSPVSGYSSFGSYTGNGSTDGPFVYTGFRPRWVMVKCSSTNNGYTFWEITDTARGSYNPSTPTLAADLSDAEGSANLGAPPVDMLSNGFKIRTTGSGKNISSQTYIYAAFAEAPFNYSRAR
jgi:hypothetical protein